MHQRKKLFAILITRIRHGIDISAFTSSYFITVFRYLINYDAPAADLIARCKRVLLVLLLGKKMLHVSKNEQRMRDGSTSRCRDYSRLIAARKLCTTTHIEQQTFAIINRARNCTKRARARARYRRAFYANSRLIWHFRDFEIPLVLCE